MLFSDVLTVLLRPSRTFEERNPSVSESALVVLTVAAVTAATRVISVWAYPGSETVVGLVSGYVIPTVLSFVFAWVLVAGALVVLIPSRVEDLGGMLATIGWGFVPAVLSAVVRPVQLVTMAIESRGSLWLTIGGTGYGLVFAFAAVAVVWQWYITFQLVRARYDVEASHAAVATAVPFGAVLANGVFGLSLGLPSWGSVGYRTLFFGLSVLVVNDLRNGTLLQSSPDGSKGKQRGSYRNRIPWLTFGSRVLGVCFGGAGFVILGGSTYLVG
ncbi:hypothetical protein [Halorussus aquaticus]|uniref:Yip1 domain-containing protein n=1 Tax=Halorussus aquaticus TaxID=2953748 RepID=A0ABD5PXD7_9EURY|nr:hypothetical protein [Halorussus aquaticus]